MIIGMTKINKLLAALAIVGAMVLAGCASGNKIDYSSLESDHPSRILRAVGGELEDWDKAPTHPDSDVYAAKVSEYGAFHINESHGRLLRQLNPPATPGTAGPVFETRTSGGNSTGLYPIAIYGETSNDSRPIGIATVKVRYEVGGTTNDFHIVVPAGQFRTVKGATRIQCIHGRVSVYGEFTAPPEE